MTTTQPDAGRKKPFGAYTAPMLRLGAFAFAFLPVAAVAHAQGAGTQQRLFLPPGIQSTQPVHGYGPAQPSQPRLFLPPGITSTAPIDGYGAAPVGQQRLFPPPGITSTAPIDTYAGRRNGGTGRGTRGQFGGGIGYGGLAVPFGYGGLGDTGGVGFAYLNSDAFDPLDPNNVPPPAASVQSYPQQAAPAAYGQQAGAAPTINVVGANNYYGNLPAGSSPTPVPPPSAPAIAAIPAVPVATAPLPEEDVVTIVFKDGRPNEQVRNYALTRTMLIVTGKRVRSIPVDQIDLPATVKLNDQAGVEFQLPAAK